MDFFKLLKKVGERREVPVPAPFDEDAAGKEESESKKGAAASKKGVVKKKEKPEATKVDT